MFHGRLALSNGPVQAVILNSKSANRGLIVESVSKFRFGPVEVSRSRAVIDVDEECIQMCSGYSTTEATQCRKVCFSLSSMRSVISPRNYPLIEITGIDAGD
jgi:hypothetical protein